MRQAPEEYLVQWRDRIAEWSRCTRGDSLPVIVLQLGDVRVALPATSLVKVAERRVVCTVPHSCDRRIRGMVNVDSELLVCVDLWACATWPDAAETPGETAVVEKYLVVVESGRFRVAVPAVKMLGRRTVPIDQLSPVCPDSPAGGVSSRRVVEIHGSKVMIFDDSFLNTVLTALEEER